MDKHLLDQIGQSVTLRQSRRNKPDLIVEGMIDRAERVPGMTITTEDGRFLAMRFRIKPSDGSRAVWTHALADRAFPLATTAATSVSGTERPS